MWDKVIELPDHEFRLRELFDILVWSLTRDEVEEFAKELLSGLGRESPVLEGYDYKIDS